MVIDHAAEARKILGAVEPYTNKDLGVAMNFAHIHATLALVEQQRIANLISAAVLTADEPPTQLVADARAALTIYRKHSLGGWHEFRPEVAKAIGIKENPND